MKINPMLMTDFYKISHRVMSEKGTEKIYSTFTPRGSRIKDIDKVVFFGLQGFIKDYLIDYFNDNFFNKDKNEVIQDYKRIITYTLGGNSADTTHIEALHDLGYLPLRIKAVKEGTLVPLRVPIFTIENTHKEFYWLTNFLETLVSASMWKVITATTIVKQYRDICDKWADKTCDSNTHVQWQCHNFSYRGMSSNEDAITSGAGQLLFFTGTDTIPSIQYLEQYYNANVEKELIGASVNATEHSIQCQYQDDLKYWDRMINDIVPEGIVSIVSDGYDYWNVIDNVIPALKQDILNRNGKVVIRPDSGTPLKVICGDEDSENETIRKGSIEALWDIFGGTINTKGYKVLDSHIGLIYGDAITPDTANDIFTKLEEKGFSSENVVFGIGSYSLGFHTRDTFGFALKSTYNIIDGKEVNIFKDPKTDIDKLKKSQTGIVVVIENDGVITYKDGLNREQADKFKERDLLEDVFVDGKLVRDDSLAKIRARVLK
jgi:nicotinamide phosphoribosyltransferase